MELQCPIDGKVFSSYYGLANHIRSHNMTSHEFYDKFWKCESEDICNSPDCRNKTKFMRLSIGYNKYCSKKCGNGSSHHVEAVKNRFNNPKTKKQWLEKRAALWKEKSIEEKQAIRQKILTTIYKRYGKNYFSNKAKEQWAKLTPQERCEISQKAMNSKKNSFKYKEIVWDFRKTYIQGYEPSVLVLLKEMGFLESDIKIGKYNKIQISYISPITGRRHVYYPDISIPKFNLIIEVKSNYSYNVHKETVLEKSKETKRLGYNYVLCVFKRDPSWGFKLNDSLSRKQAIIDIRKFEKDLDWAISSQASKEEGSTTSFMRRIQENSKSGGLQLTIADMI